jgi:hypothetical protein
LLELKLTSLDREALREAGMNLKDIQVFKHKQHFGYTYKSKQSQVVIHGRHQENNYAEVLYLLKRRDSNTFYILVQDLDVEFVPHLGLHACSRACSKSLLKFEDLISSCPLNMYTAVNHLKESINYVIKHEALLYD